MDSRLGSDERKLFGEHRAAVNHGSISTIEPHGLSLIIQANAELPTAQLNRDLFCLTSSWKPCQVANEVNDRQHSNQLISVILLLHFGKN